MKSTLEYISKLEPNWCLALFGIAEDLNLDKLDIQIEMKKIIYDDIVIIFNHQGLKYSTKWNSALFYKLKDDKNVYNIYDDILFFFNNYKDIEQFWLNDLLNFFDPVNDKYTDLFNICVKHIYGPEYEVLDIADSIYNLVKIQLQSYTTLNKDFKLKKGKEIEYIYKKLYHYTKDCLFTYIKLKEIGVNLTGLKLENLSIVFKSKELDVDFYEFQRFIFSEHINSDVQIHFKIQGDKTEYNIKKYYKLFYENYKDIIFIKISNSYAFIKYLEDNIYIPHNISGLAYVDEDRSDSGYYVEGVKQSYLDFKIAQREWKYKRLT